MISISDKFIALTKTFYLEHFKITFYEVFYFLRYKSYKTKEESIKIEPFENFGFKKSDQLEALIKHKDELIGFYDYIERKKYSRFKTNLILTLYSEFLLNQLDEQRENLEISLIIEYLSRSHKQYFPDTDFCSFIEKIMENTESREDQNVKKLLENLLSKNLEILEDKREVKIKARFLKETQAKMQLRYYDFRYEKFDRWLWVPKNAIIKREQPTKLTYQDGAVRRVPENYTYFWIEEDQLIKQKIDYQFIEDLSDDEVEKDYPFE